MRPKGRNPLTHATFPSHLTVCLTPSAVRGWTFSFLPVAEAKRVSGARLQKTMRLWLQANQWAYRGFTFPHQSAVVWPENSQQETLTHTGRSWQESQHRSRVWLKNWLTGQRLSRGLLPLLRDATATDTDYNWDFFQTAGKKFSWIGCVSDFCKWLGPKIWF